MALRCKICGYKQYDADAIKSFKKTFPDMEEHDMPYYCGACLDHMSNEEYTAAQDEMNGKDCCPEPKLTQYWTKEELEKMTRV